MLLSIVVIGLNEEDNLENTFDSISRMNYPREAYRLIYVDTGSADRSVEIAKKFCDDVFIEKSDWPTPGLARNRGLKESDTEIIHFLDGDIEIEKDYLGLAIKKMEEKKVDAVFGALEEKSKKGINKILLNNWKNRKEGYYDFTGGGGTYRREALISAGGYDAKIRRGEETELGERFREKGYKIWYMEEKMGIHNYGVKTFFDLIKIFYIDGLSKAYLFINYENRIFYRRNNKYFFNNIYFILFHFAILLSIPIYGFINVIISLTLMNAIYFIWKYKFIRNNSKVELFYNLLSYLFRPFVCWGQVIGFLKFKSKLNRKAK